MSDPYNTIIAAPSGSIIIVPDERYNEWNGMARALRKGRVKVLSRGRFKQAIQRPAHKKPINYIYADEETA